MNTLTEPSQPATAIRAQVREADQTLRRIIARAAHMEKRAERAEADSAERLRLEARARELRAAAAALVAEISDLCRQVIAA
jgi:hypothetical protein